MAFTTFHKISITFFAIIFFQCKVPAQLPGCKDSFPTSLLLNSSFEQFSGCSQEYEGDLEGGLIDYFPLFGGIKVNNWHIRAINENTKYFNYNCRSGKPSSIFDSLIGNSTLPKVPQPLPDSAGFIGLILSENDNFVNEKDVLKCNVTQCLSQPLYAGQPYVFNFYFGFGKQTYTTGSITVSASPYNIAIFGRQDCPQYPIMDFTHSGGCLTNDAGWVQLGKVTLKGGNEWVQGVIEFTPKTNISCIGVGPDCSLRGFSTLTQYFHYMDKFILAPKADFSFKTITAVAGNVCTGNLTLKAPTYPNATYQWYKDGILIANAASQLYTVPDAAEAAGAYITNISLPYNTCLNTLPYQVSFSDLQKFHLGNDTLLCAPAEISLNAAWPDVQQYLWQDGSTNATLTVNKTGTYSVQLTDNKGCTKKDSIKVTIQGCDECELYTPTAFTPNNDGLNDVFRVLTKCANVGLQSFKMRIYNRWGQPVFSSNDIHTGWDGTYKRNLQDRGVYVYYIEYAFKKDQSIKKQGTIVLVR